MGKIFKKNQLTPQGHLNKILCVVPIMRNVRFPANKPACLQELYH